MADDRRGALAQGAYNADVVGDVRQHPVSLDLYG